MVRFLTGPGPRAKVQNHCNPQSYRIFGDFLNPPGSPVHQQSSSEMGNMPKETAYIWIYTCRIMFWRYVNHLQSSYHHWAWTWRQRGEFTLNLPIGMIWFWSCSPSLQYWFIYIFVYWLRHLACWKLFVDWNRHHEFASSKCLRGLLYNQVAFLYTLPAAYSTPITWRSDLSVFNSWYMTDQASVSLWFPLRHYLQIIVHQVYWLFVHHKFTSSVLAIQAQLLKSKHDGLG